MATSDPVLDLTTDDARPTVRINHVDYLLRTSNDLTLDVYRAFQRVSPRIGVLLLQATLTPEEGSELSQLLDQVCRFALVAPDALHARLGDVHRMQVFAVFTQLLTPSLLQATRASLGRRSAGTSSSPDSNGSTAGVSTTGARRSRSASSRRH